MCGEEQRTEMQHVGNGPRLGGQTCEGALELLHTSRDRRFGLVCVWGHVAVQDELDTAEAPLEHVQRLQQHVVHGFG